MTQDIEDNSVAFEAYVLLTEAVQFNTAEIRTALFEDYPSLEISPDGVGAALDRMWDTADVITAPLLMGHKGLDAAHALLTRLPGYGKWDPKQIRRTQALNWPDVNVDLSHNNSYVCVSVRPLQDGMASAFRAARLCSCIAAIYAKLPVTLGCYWGTADHFIGAKSIVQMAEKSLSDDWPVHQWIGFDLQRGRDGERLLSAGLTKGLAAFTGYEISYAAAPTSERDVASWLYSSAQMALSFGSQFHDGDTISLEGDEGRQPIRIRHVPKGTNGSQADTKLLVHPDSPVDHEALAGPIMSTPPPPGFDNTRSADPGFFKRMIRGRRAS